MVRMFSLIFALTVGSVPYAFAKEIKVGVNGMVCSFCAQGIQKKFSEQAAVKSVFVSLGDHLVKLDLKDGQNLDDEKIKQVLTDAGYTVTGIDRD